MLASTILESSLQPISTQSSISSWYQSWAPHPGPSEASLEPSLITGGLAPAQDPTGHSASHDGTNLHPHQQVDSRCTRWALEANGAENQPHLLEHPQALPTATKGPLSPWRGNSLLQHTALATRGECAAVPTGHLLRKATFIRSGNVTNLPNSQKYAQRIRQTFSKLRNKTKPQKTNLTKWR